MRLDWIATCLAIMLLAGPALATDQEQKQKVAKDKAEVLEQKATQDSSPAPAPKSQAISQPEAQAVDPAGKAPRYGLRCGQARFGNQELPVLLVV